MDLFQTFLILPSVDFRNSTHISETSQETKESFIEFNDFYDLNGSKRMLWELFRAAAVGNYSSLSEIERDDIATFYERMDKLLETVHQIGWQNEEKSLPPKGGSTGSGS